MRQNAPRRAAYDELPDGGGEMHGSLPFIGISTLIYGLVGLCGLTAWAGSTVRTRVRSNGGAGGAHHGESHQ